jgi:integrase
MSARRGSGCLYQQKNRHGEKAGPWWIKYSVNGQARYESTGTTDKDEAQRLLNERLGRVATGSPLPPRVDKILYDELAQDLRQHYEATGSRDLVEAAGRLAHLDPYFRGRRAMDIRPAVLTDCIVHRQREAASNGTINRELGVLSKMLRLGFHADKVGRLPKITKLREAAPRSGFFEDEQYHAVGRQLEARPDLQVANAIAHTYGWRMQSEVLTLERRQVDLRAGTHGTLTIDPGMTKNDDGRVVYLTPELRGHLEGQLERVEALGRSLGRIIPFLFPHLGNGRLQGTRIKDFRRAWKTATRRAGVPGRIRHDFRRTAVRNLTRRGVVERVAMKMTGHRTRSVFERYNIVSDGDLREAARKMAEPGTTVMNSVMTRREIEKPAR